MSITDTVYIGTRLFKRRVRGTAAAECAFLRQWRGSALADEFVHSRRSERAVLSGHGDGRSPPALQGRAARLQATVELSRPAASELGARWRLNGGIAGQALLDKRGCRLHAALAAASSAAYTSDANCYCQGATVAN